MNRFVRNALLLAFILPGLTGGYAVGQDRLELFRADGPREGHAAIGHLLECLPILGLADDQKANIRSFLETEKTNAKPLVEAVKADREALRAAVASGNACDVGNAFLKTQGDRKALRAEFTKVLSTVEGMLTPDQKTKLEGCLQAPGPPRSR